MTQYKYKEFTTLDKHNKDVWYDFIFDKGTYIEYLANIYEFIGESETDIRYWILSDINSGDTIQVKPITIWNNDKYTFIKEK